MITFYEINADKIISVIDKKEADISVFNALLVIYIKRYFQILSPKISFLIDSEKKEGVIIMAQSTFNNPFLILLLIDKIELFFRQSQVYDIETTVLNKKLRKIITRYNWQIIEKRFFWGNRYKKVLPVL